MRDPPTPLLPVNAAPRVYLADDFVSPAERAALFLRDLAPEAMAARGLPLEPTAHGAWRDLESLPGLRALEGRVRALVGADASTEVVRRLRCYESGQGHPAHEDRYTAGGLTLYATALLVLEAPERGGETRFPLAEPERLRVRALAGRLVLWYGFTPAGEPDPRSRHDAAAVEAGRKLTLTFFFYGRLCPAELEGPPGPRRFVFVTEDSVPEETSGALRAAALARGLDWRPIAAGTYDFDLARRLRPGDLVYRAAVSTRAGWVEQHLWRDGAVGFFAAPRGPFQELSNQRWLLERAGVPVPESLPATTSDRGRLRAWTGRLGGLPLVIKFGGREGGVGTLRVDSLPALFSLIDHARAGGELPILMRYLPDTVCWRVIVVGDRAVAAYPNPVAEDDFRSRAPDDPAAYHQTPPDGLEQLAVAATAALDLEFGGVDLLAAPSGRAWVLEVNSPCYFGHAQETGGVDVAGAMVDFLLQKAARAASQATP